MGNTRGSRTNLRLIIQSSAIASSLTPASPLVALVTRPDVASTTTHALTQPHRPLQCSPRGPSLSSSFPSSPCLPSLLVADIPENAQSRYGTGSSPGQHAYKGPNGEIMF